MKRIYLAMLIVILLISGVFALNETNLSLNNITGGVIDNVTEFVENLTFENITEVIVNITEENITLNQINNTQNLTNETIIESQNLSVNLTNVTPIYNSIVDGQLPHIIQGVTQENVYQWTKTSDTEPYWNTVIISNVDNKIEGYIETTGNGTLVMQCIAGANTVGEKNQCVKQYTDYENINKLEKAFNITFSDMALNKNYHPSNLLNSFIKNNTVYYVNFSYTIDKQNNPKDYKIKYGDNSEIFNVTVGSLVSITSTCIDITFSGSAGGGLNSLLVNPACDGSGGAGVLYNNTLYPDEGDNFNIMLFNSSGTQIGEFRSVSANTTIFESSKVRAVIRFSDMNAEGKKLNKTYQIYPNGKIIYNFTIDNVASSDSANISTVIVNSWYWQTGETNTLWWNRSYDNFTFDASIQGNCDANFGGCNLTDTGIGLPEIIRLPINFKWVRFFDFDGTHDGLAIHNWSSNLVNYTVGPISNVFKSKFGVYKGNIFNGMSFQLVYKAYGNALGNSVIANDTAIDAPLNVNWRDSTTINISEPDKIDRDPYEEFIIFNTSGTVNTLIYQNGSIVNQNSWAATNSSYSGINNQYILMVEPKIFRNGSILIYLNSQPTIQNPKFFVWLTKVWEYIGSFTGPETPGNFSDEINNYLENCTADEEGYCLVPLNFSSESNGILEISDINIQYQYVDTNPPSIKWVSVLPNSTTKDTQVNIKANVTDLNLSYVEARLNNGVNLTYNSTSKLWEGNLIAPSAGDYYINITAKDWKNLTTILKTPLNISASNELLITSLQYDNYLIENTTVNINATVNNYGSNPANNFIVGLYVDNNNIYNQTVSVNGKSSNISKLYWNATYGNHTIKAKADVSNIITEDDENNNELSSNITVNDGIAPAINDIMANSVSENTLLIIKSNVTDNIGISNVNANINNNTINLTYNSTSTLYEGSATIANNGFFDLTITAKDTSGLTSSKKQTVEIYSVNADLTLESINFNQLPVADGINNVIIINVRNKGGSNANNFIVEAIIANTTQNATLSVNSDSTNSTAFSWLGEYGTQILSVNLDKTNVITESNESNNFNYSINVADITPALINSIDIPDTIYISQNFNISVNITDNVNVSSANATLGSSNIILTYNSTTGLYYGSLTAPATAGIYNLNITALDTSNILSVRTRNIEVYGNQPDLTLTPLDLILLPRNVSEPSQLYINVTIHNKGGSDASAFTLKLDIDGFTDDRQMSIEKGSINSTQFNWTSAYSNYTVKITADSLSAITESNETNNILTKDIFVLDTTAPAKLNLTANPSSWTSQDTFTISWNSVTDTNGIDRYEYIIDDGNWVNLSNTTTSFVTPQLSEGIHTIYARVVDIPGNEGEIANASLYIDKTSPNIPIIREWHTGGNWTNHDSAYYSWSDPGDQGSGVVNFTGLLDNSTVELGYNLTYHVNLTTGIHTFKVKARDALNQESNWSNEITVYIDTALPQPPVINSLTHKNNSTYYDNNIPIFNLTSASDDSGILGYYYLVDNNENTKSDVASLFTRENTFSFGSSGNAVSNATINKIGMPDGTWYLHAIAIDNAGNLGDNSSSFMFKIQHVIEENITENEKIINGTANPAHVNENITFNVSVNIEGNFLTTRFNNSLTTESLQYSGNQNITRYLGIEKSANVSLAIINITGTGNAAAFTEGNYTGNFSLTSGNTEGLVTDNNYIWSVDSTNGNQRVYKYYMNGSYTGESCALSVESNNNPTGITKNDTSFFVTDIITDKIIVYNSSCGFITNYNIASESLNSKGITLENNNLWVLDSVNLSIFKYNISGSYLGTRLDLTSGNSNPTDISTNGTYFWIADGNDNVYKYYLNGTFISSFSLYSQNTDATGITQNSTTIFVSDIADDLTYKYNMNRISSTENPNNPYLDVGEDSVKEWNYSGNFNSEIQVNNFANTINSYLQSCSAVNGNCTVPVIFHSDSNGNLTYNYIKIYYSKDNTNSVWLVVWDGVAEYSNKLYEGFLSFTQGVWTTIINVGSNFKPETNYTIYANDSSNVTYAKTGNFSVRTDNNLVCSNSSLCEYQTITNALDGENNTNLSIQLIDKGNYVVEKTITFASPTILFNSSGQLLDCNGSKLQRVSTASSGMAIRAIPEKSLDNITVRNCAIEGFANGIEMKATNSTTINVHINGTESHTMNVASNAYIYNVTIFNSGGDGLMIDGAGTSNILIDNSNITRASLRLIKVSTSNAHNISVINSYFDNSTGAAGGFCINNMIGFDKFINNTVKNCASDTIISSGWGALAIGFSNTIIANNTFENNAIAMQIGGGTLTSNITIQNNIINKSIYGIYNPNGNLEYITIENNSIYESYGDAIRLVQDDESDIYQNIIIAKNSIYNTSFTNSITGEQAFDLFYGTLTGTKFNTTVYLNNFYSQGLNTSISNETNYCFNNEGNFYEENLTLTGNNDCGSVNLTYPIGGENITSQLANITWARQSSINLINYYLYYYGKADYAYDNDANCVLSLPFDENSGTTANDKCSNNIGELKNGVLFSNGVYNSSIKLDGINDYVNINNSNSLNVYPITIETWFRVSQSVDNAAIINKYNGGSYNGYQLFTLSGNLRAWYFKDSSNYVYDGDQGLNGGNISDNKWHYAVFSINSTGGYLYVDNALRDSRAWAGTPGATTSSLNLSIGLYPGNAYFNGLIDSTVIYNRSLSASEISEHYNRYKWNYINNTNSLSYMWNLSNLINGNEYKVKVKPYSNGYYGINNISGDFSVSL